MLELIQRHNIEQTVKRCQEIGSANAIKLTEREKGFTIVEPDEKPWFKSSDWRDSIISTDGKIVRIVALIARHPRRGAFRRMIRDIKADGLVPMVICPFDGMTKILKKWGWRETVIDGGYDESEEQWTEK